MRIELIKNFVTNEEAQALNQFTLDCVKNGLFEDGRASKHLNEPGAHMVSRFNKELNYPDTAYQVKQRIMDVFGFLDQDVYKMFNDSGIAVNCSFKGGQLWEHVDAREHNKALLRCTVVTSQPQNSGIFHVEGQPVQLHNCDLYACLVSEHRHYCTKNEEDIPRIVWQFGFNVDVIDWNSGKIEVNDVSVS